MVGRVGGGGGGEVANPKGKETALLSFFLSFCGVGCVGGRLGGGGGRGRQLCT